MTVPSEATWIPSSPLSLQMLPRMVAWLVALMPSAVFSVEKEFSIKLDKGNTLQAGNYRFQVVNVGKIEHDLEIRGGGLEKKTALIQPGNEAALEADLKPAKYRFYCTVPGHAQSGMDIDVTVR